MPQNKLGKKHLSLISVLFTLHWQRVHSVPCLIQEDPVKRTTLVSSRHVLVMSLRIVSAWQGSVTQRGQHSFSGRTLNSQSASGHGKGQQSTSPCCLQMWQEQRRFLAHICFRYPFLWLSSMFLSWLVLSTWSDSEVSTGNTGIHCLWQTQQVRCFFLHAIHEVYYI